MVLDIRQLRQHYGQREVLNIPHVTMESGIHWILGENGAGKSTLFRVLAGMLPFTGNVLLDGQFDLKKQQVDYLLRLNLGEAEPLYPAFLTPGDMLDFVAEAKQAPEGQVQMLIDSLGINYLTNTFGSCSSGMVKKVSLALAFLGNPKLIILDEPLITIDAEARQALFGLIRNYRQNGVSFLLSSHQSFAQEGLEITKTFRLKDKSLTEIPNL